MKELRNHYLRLLKCKQRRQTKADLTTAKVCGQCASGRQIVVSGGGRESNVMRSGGTSAQIGNRCICNGILAPSVIFKQNSQSD